MIPFKDVIGGDIICVNTPSTHGSVGLTTGVPPSMTLGCGTPGGNITSDNITPLHLINTKRLAFEIRTIDQIQFQLSDEPVAASTNRVKQTTVRDELEEHVNCVNSLEEFKQQCYISNLLYSGELDIDVAGYTRYMLIGRK